MAFHKHRNMQCHAAWGRAAHLFYFFFSSENHWHVFLSPALQLITWILHVADTCFWLWNMESQKCLSSKHTLTLLPWFLYFAFTKHETRMKWKGEKENEASYKNNMADQYCITAISFLLCALKVGWTYSTSCVYSYSYITRNFLNILILFKNH